MAFSEPLGGAAGIRGPRKKRSKAQQARDLRRSAQLHTQRAAEARKGRREAWPEGQSEFAVERQEARLSVLGGEKRELRRDVYREAPMLEGRPVYRSQPRGAGA